MKCNIGKYSFTLLDCGSILVMKGVNTITTFKPSKVITDNVVFEKECSFWHIDNAY